MEIPGTRPVLPVDDDGTSLPVEENTAIPAGTSGLLAAGKDQDGKAQFVSVDSQGRLVLAAQGTSAPTKGFVAGQLILASTAITAVRKTAYVEPASAAQRSIASASAADTNTAGTGARKVKITYYDGTMDGPFTETVNLNGTTPVNTVAVNIRFIESMEVVEVGSGNLNAGIISLFGSTGGAGGTVWTIGLGENRTLAAHHYVGVGKVCNITGFFLAIKGADTTGGLITAKNPLGTNPVEIGVSDTIRAPVNSSIFRPYGTPILVPGPSRVVAYALPDSSSTRTYYASFDFFDE